jgi:hypothetical protein
LTSERPKLVGWAHWTFGLIAQLVLASAGAAQGVGIQQTCVAAESNLPMTRFQDNGDGTVTDVDSKLMWMRCPSGQRWVNTRCTGQAATYNWVDAVRQANQISSNGEAFFNDWRVPALRDLATITDRGCKNPRTNLVVFPGTPATAFWTSTPRPGGKSEDLAFTLSFGEEGVMAARKDERFYVRFVRNAM